MELSHRGEKMTELSGIRSVLADIAEAGGGAAEQAWINLSPGNPARIPAVEQVWRELYARVLERDFGDFSGRYGPSRGTDTLVDEIVRYFRARYGWDIGPENVVVGPGSQLLGFIATTLFTGPYPGGRRQLVLPATPDYTGYQGLSMDRDVLTGVAPRIELLADRRFRYTMDLDALVREKSMGMMLVSNPSNPSGRSLGTDELNALAELATERDIPLVVDNAYGRPFPGVADAEADPTWHPKVINTFTLSKAGLPGERLGFAIGPAELIDPMVAFLANSTLHSPQLVQAAASRALSSGQLDHLTNEVIAPYYRRKRLAVEKLLHDAMPDSLDWRLHTSDGGMFCWLWINETWFDDLDLYHRLKRAKVFIVPGRHFFPRQPEAQAPAEHATRCIRISLSPDESVIGAGIGRIVAAIEEQRRAH